MKSWPKPIVPQVPGTPIPLSLYDSADQRIKPVELPESGPVGMYVCGITPYDATHLGHAATYLTFDLINRVLLDNGYEVNYVQNVTDIDEPLFERAQRDGVHWRDLGDNQIELFRSDMTALQVLPPQHFIGATEAIAEAAELAAELLDNGSAYIIDDPEFPDIYARCDATPDFGYESNYSTTEMINTFAERGGDPERPAKKFPLDALLWRMERDGEPAWDSVVGRGRPGWHIECAAIAANRLGNHFAIQGGGADLAFPHHEYSAAHVEAARNSARMAGHYVHTGMIGLNGTKMSKSLGNLVFVSVLTREGHEPSAIRLGVYAGHYRAARDWNDQLLAAAEDRLERWRQALERPFSLQSATTLLTQVREFLAADLDTPGALQAIDTWAAQVLAATSAAPVDPEAKELVDSGIAALLGVQLIPLKAVNRTVGEIQDQFGAQVTEFIEELDYFARGSYLTPAERKNWIEPFDPAALLELEEILREFLTGVELLGDRYPSYDLYPAMTAHIRNLHAALTDFNARNYDAILEPEEYPTINKLTRQVAQYLGITPIQLVDLPILE